VMASVTSDSTERREHVIGKPVDSDADQEREKAICYAGSAVNLNTPGFKSKASKSTMAKQYVLDRFKAQIN
jgi:hypothetical protein